MEPITATAGVLVARLASSPTMVNVDGQGLTSSAVAGVILSHLIQPHMESIPVKLKPLVPIAIGFGSAVIACMSQGMGLRDGLHYGLVTTVSALVNHRLAFAKPAPITTLNLNS